MRLNIVQKIVIGTIKVYQKTISPDHGVNAVAHPYGFCRYYPSCSEYAVRAISKRGVARGFLLSCWRVLRCNPFSRGGLDDIK